MQKVFTFTQIFSFLSSKKLLTQSFMSNILIVLYLVHRFLLIIIQSYIFYSKSIPNDHVFPLFINLESEIKKLQAPNVRSHSSLKKLFLWNIINLTSIKTIIFFTRNHNKYLRNIYYSYYELFS